MNRRTKGVLLIGSLAVTTVMATIAVLTTALARSLDPGEYCQTGFSKLVSCRLHLSTHSVGQGTPIFSTPSNTTSPAPASARETFQPSYVDVTLWAIAECPQNSIARRLLCAAPSGAAPAQAASDDAGLPLPRPWFVRTGKSSRFIESVHVETPLDLAAALGFYRVELSKRGWTENDGALLAPDRAMIAFTTKDGPALLRLTHQDGRTSADLSLRKPAAANAGIRPKPGQVRLMLGNATDEVAVITINEQTITLPARAGQQLTDDPETGRKSSGGQEIDLPPGKHKVTFKVASGAAQNREFEIAADETWGLLVGPDGVPLPLHLY